MGNGISRSSSKEKCESDNKFWSCQYLDETTGLDKTAQE